MRLQRAKVKTATASPFRTGIGFALSSLFVVIAFFVAHKAFAENTDNQDAANQQEALRFIENITARALEVMRDADMPQEEREQHFREILHDGFAVDKIGQLVLGRHRKKATPQELQTYHDLFPEFLIKVYATRLSKLETKDIVIGRIIPHGSKDLFIRSQVIDDKNETFDVDWRVRPYGDSGYKILDIKIEGISMARTQRDDFTSRVLDSGMSGLNQYMKDIIEGKLDTDEEEEVHKVEAPDMNQKKRLD
ncbi:MlaC/ttg2D family ABC transporter substrate-binding protein [Luteithermobacter gelatinilyticus]|uniref:MlaC/ttg2D family ABC transporter substrate-binding protein n=1 Tax=Luteithermobacter gelatinilyticus TaxID=2582913 RepID=UPI0011067DA2|nr:ABC transporter substrate-binding protein [Luteithermobacter gelatinilyticus]